MRVIDIINLKGGVAKTISAINIAHVLAAIHRKRILMIDNDKQGNTTKFWGLHSYDRPGIAELLTQPGMDVRQVIQPTGIAGIGLIPANMSLLSANSSLLINMSRGRDYRLRRALDPVRDAYDFCVIDNAPDINVGVINALMAADDVLVPVKIDQFAFDGLAELIEQVDEIRESNSSLRFAGCFFTMYQRNKANQRGDVWLHDAGDYPIFKTRIRSTVKVTETTYEGKPLLVHAPRSTAAQDYVALVAEYLEQRKEGADGEI